MGRPSFSFHWANRSDVALPLASVSLAPTVFEVSLAHTVRTNGDFFLGQPPDDGSETRRRGGQVPPLLHSVGEFAYFVTCNADDSALRHASLSLVYSLFRSIDLNCAAAR